MLSHASEQRNNLDTFATFNQLLITVLRFDGLLAVLFFHFHYFGSKI